MKRTPWFPASTPPVREGIYEYRCSVGRIQCARRDAAWLRDRRDWCCQWRGLTKPAKGE